METLKASKTYPNTFEKVLLPDGFHLIEPELAISTTSSRMLHDSAIPEPGQVCLDPYGVDSPTAISWSQRRFSNSLFVTTTRGEGKQPQFR